MFKGSCFITDILFGVKLKKFFINYWRLTTQKHSVSIGFFCFGFSFYELFNRQFTEAFFIFKTVLCLWVKRFYTNTLLFFFLLGTRSPLRKSYISLHSTKWKTWERRRLSAMEKLLRFLWCWWAWAYLGLIFTKVQ